MLTTTTIGVDRPPRRDIYLRERLFDEASFTHHAKMNLNLVQRLIERYSMPGDLVLDPMGGAGSVLVGLLSGRKVATGDIEVQWARLLGRNVARCRQDLVGFATPGLAAQWDAAKLPLAGGQCDLVLTSPPYFDTFSNWDASSNILEERQNEHGLSYGVHPAQIANHHVYEEYLRAMARVYAELWRVLRHQGKMALVVKDVIRGGRVVPVVEDNLCLAVVSGFKLLERFDVPARGTRFRNVNAARLGQAAPATEPVLVFGKVADHQAKKRLALLELPLAHDGPGWTICHKAMARAREAGFELWQRVPGWDEWHPLPSVTPLVQRDRRKLKAAVRRENSFSAVRNLVEKAGLRAGDEIRFYGSDARYGRYVCRRLETLGCRVTSPLLGLNNGQRLAWLTRRFEINVVDW